VSYVWAKAPEVDLRAHEPLARSQSFSRFLVFRSNNLHWKYLAFGVHLHYKSCPVADTFALNLHIPTHFLKETLANTQTKSSATLISFLVVFEAAEIQEKL
jgi:hypothetical protein